MAKVVGKGSIAQNMEQKEERIKRICYENHGENILQEMDNLNFEFKKPLK